MNLYRTIDVWKEGRPNDCPSLYRLLSRLQSKKYCVQSADFFRLPLDAKQVSSLDSQFVQLFIEQEPSDRTAEFAKLEDAIAAHDKDFL